MARVAEEARFGWFAHALAEDATLDDLRRAALAVYAPSSDSFTALHLVTAAHAMRIVSSRIPSLGLVDFWQAFGAAYVTLGAPELDPAVPPSTASWDRIFAAACASPDDHVIKFCYTCHQETEAGGDPAYHGLAAIKAGV